MADYQQGNNESQFKPVYTADLTNRLVSNYRQNPKKFNENLISQLEEHANHYDIRFNRNVEDEEFKLLDTVKQAGTGFISGFTTLNYGDPPKNPYENIAHSIGHLAGFVGWVPGASAKSGVAVLRALSLLKGKSVPMIAANALTKPVTEVASKMVQTGFGKRSDAVSSVAKLLYNDKARDAVEGAFHLGTASAVSSWTHGIDAMVDSAIHGAVAGGAFRTIGNLLKSPLPKDNALAENALGSVAGALFTGLPATMRGATAPEQIYEYLLGAYFGFNESPSSRRVAQRYRYEELQKEVSSQAMGKKLEEDLLTKDWSPETKRVVEQFSKESIQQEQSMEMMRRLGRDHPAINQAIEAGFISREGRPPTVEQVESVKDTIFKTEKPIEPEKEVLKKESKEVIKEIEKTQEAEKELLEREDTGVVIDAPLNVKDWAVENIEKSWIKEDGMSDIFKKKANIEDLNIKLSEKIKNKDLDIDELANWMKVRYNYDITSPEATERNFFRTFLKRKMLENNVNIASPEVEIVSSWTPWKKGGKIVKDSANKKIFFKKFEKLDNFEVIELNPNNPQNIVGNRKSIPMPIFEVENVYNKITGNNLDLSDANQRPLRMVNEVVIKTKDGFPKESSLLNFKESIRRDIYKENSKLKGHLQATLISDKKSNEIYNELIGNLHENMRKKGYYYFSGRADADKMMYMKHHPEIAKRRPSEIKSIINDLIKDVKQFKKEDIIADREDFAKRYKGQIKNPRELYNRAMVSNLYYNMDINGIKPLPSSIKNGKRIPSNYKEVSDTGFITNPIAFNKRAQIWHTSGYPLDRVFLQKEIPDMVDGKFKMTITKTVEDLPKELIPKPWEKTKNTDTVEHVDGGKPGRDDVMTAIHKETGMYDPLNPSGHSKNFTISIGEEGKGAMLLKDMDFDAGSLQSAAMAKEGLHFMPNTQGAKQYGKRKAMFHELVNGEFKYFNWIKKKGKWIKEYGEPEYFFVDAKDVKTVLSETTDVSNIKDKRLVKQIQTNFSSLNKNITPELTESFYTDYNLRGFHGKERFNEQFKEYMETKNPELLESIVKNVEQISTPEITRALTEPGYEELQLRLYEKIFKINRENEKSSLLEGEISDLEFNETIRELNTYKSTADRNLRLADNNISVYLHKFNSPLKRNIIKKYIVSQITRPIVPNSLGGRLRPYDLELQQNPVTKRLNTEKDLIFLDNGAKAKIPDYTDLIAFLDAKGERKSRIKAITTTKGRRRNLGELWEYRNKIKDSEPKTVEYIDNFLEGITTRVPIDSTSGSVVLKFGGFTGRKGFGGIVHGEVMSKIGGADNDGDKFFMYFGTKPEYKQIFKENANEFIRYFKKSEYLQDPNNLKSKITKEEYNKLTDKEKEKWYSAISNNKTHWRHLYTVTEGKEKEHRTNPSLFYSPNHRKLISDVAVDGRNRLGPAVIDKQNLLAAYTDLRTEGVKTFTITPGKKAELTVELKTAEKEISDALERLRTAIAIPSDPLDEIGIKSRDEYFSNMFDSLFKIVDFKVKDKKGNLQDKPVHLVEPYMKRHVIMPYSNINSAYYGKNFTKGRQWTYEEMKNKGSWISEISNRVSSIARQGQDLERLDFYDGLDKRLNKAGVKKTYDEYADNIKTHNNVAKALGRAGWPVKMNKNVEEYLSYEIEDSNAKLQAEHFLSNDMHNMSAFNSFIKYWKDIPANKLEEMGKKAHEIQNESYLSRLEDKEPIKYEVKIGKKTKEINQEELNDLQRADTEFEVIRDIPQEKKSTVITQAKTDNKIYEYKKTLTPEEKVAFDGLMISGFKTGKHKDVKEFFELLDKKENLSPIEQLELERLGNIVYDTHSNSLGFASEAISDNVIKEFWNGYNKTFKNMSEKLTKEEKQDIDDVVESTKKTEAKVGEIKTDVNLEEGYESKLNKLRTLDRIPGFRRLSQQKAGKVKLTSENQKLYDELLDNLNFYGNSVGIKLEGLIGDLFMKSPDAMTIEDVKSLNHLLGSRRYGKNLGWLRKQFLKWTDGDPKLNGYFYHEFIDSIDRSWLKNDMTLVERMGYVFEPGKELPVEKLIYKPLHVGGQLQYSHTNLSNMASHEIRKMEVKIRDGLQFLNSIKEGPELHELAVYIREAPIGLTLFKEGDPIQAAAYGIRNGKLQPKIKQRIDQLADKKFNVLIGKERKALTGKQIISKVNRFWNKTLNEVYDKWITGEQDGLKKYVTKDKYDIEKGHTDTFVKDIMDAIKENKPLHEAVKIGVDGMNRMATHTQLNLTKNKKLRNKLYNRLGEATPYRKNFWAHRNYNKSDVEKALKSRMDKLKNKKITDEDRQQIVNEAATLALRLRNVQDEFDLDAYKSWSMYDEVVNAIKNKTEDRIQFANAEIRSGHTLGRNLHISGYDRSPSAGEGYAKSIIESYYNNASQIVSRKIIDRFRKDHLSKYVNKQGKIINKEGYKNIEAWENFWKLYANRALGYPEVIPDYLLNNPYMGIKGTPYHWFADSTVKNRVNKIADKMGLKKGEIPPEIEDVLSYNKLRSWSNMEAKYQLATLLSHPKTAVANIFGGSTLTIQSVGIRHWSKVRDLEWLRNNVSTEFTSREKVYEHVEKLGIIEEFIRKEIGLSGVAKDKRVKDGLELLIKKLKKDPAINDKTLKEVWKQTGLSDSLFEKAAWFMRKSERMLRADAYMAHYLHARDLFKGAITEHDHPFLIWMGKKGVKNTQFLYNAANRPGFAASALGKVMSRFQLWAWNSVKFRNMVYREAKERGFQRGTQEYKRFERTMQIDMMLFALANVFTYSLFENTLPAPLNWVQDLGDWIFGDETERDRAFFGAYPKAIAPLQMITPPALRLAPPTLKALVDDDWTRMSDYYLWTVMPFGRLARDVKIAAENPIQTVERATGLPYIKFHKYLKEQREIE